MPVKFVYEGKKKVYIYVHGEVTTEEVIAAGETLLDLAAKGYVFENPRLRKGKERFRRDRRHGAVRELTILEELGLERLDRPRVVRHPDGTVSVWLPDWEYLNWLYLTFALHRVEGTPMFLPLRANGELLAKLGPRHVRCLKGCSQSELEKHARDVPGLDKTPGALGKPFVVDTIEFFTHINDPRYPFMAWHRAPFNPIADVHRLVTRIRE